MKYVAVLLAILVASCGRPYERFTLPSPGGPETGGYVWTASPGPVAWEDVPGSPNERSGPGPADDTDALNPSVVRFAGNLFNLYSGYDGKLWRTFASRSPNGGRWTGLGPVLAPGPNTWEGGAILANGAAIVRANEIFYWYQAGEPPRIGLARSADGLTWTKTPGPVLGYGPRGSWDERALGDPYVIDAGRRLYMCYLGEDRARRQRLGMATSIDGIHWTRLAGNPVLELGSDGAFDESGLGEPAVWKDHGWWWMLYTGRDRNEVRRMGLAQSADGVKWERTDLVIEGTEAWNAKVVCDATVLVEPGRVRVWFGGGDSAHPDQNINGQIGYGELRWRADAR